MVMCVQLASRVKLTNFQSSFANSDRAFYEAELFPALQIEAWRPIHVSVFSTGKCIITGVNDLDWQLPRLLINLLLFLQRHHLLP